MRFYYFFKSELGSLLSRVESKTNFFLLRFFRSRFCSDSFIERHIFFSSSFPKLLLPQVELVALNEARHKSRSAAKKEHKSPSISRKTNRGKSYFSLWRVSHCETNSIDWLTYAGDSSSHSLASKQPLLSTYTHFWAVKLSSRRLSELGWAAKNRSAFARPNRVRLKRWTKRNSSRRRTKQKAFSPQLTGQRALFSPTSTKGSYSLCKIKIWIRVSRFMARPDTRIIVHQ